MTEPDPVGLTAARRVAAYEIGDASWANRIVDAYLNPKRALRDSIARGEARPSRCEATVMVNGGLMACDRPLDDRGYCGHERDHVED